MNTTTQPMNQSVAIILNAGGLSLDAGALADLPGATVVRAEFAWGDRATCAAVTLAHRQPCADLRPALRRWAFSHGWSLTLGSMNGGE